MAFKFNPFTGKMDIVETDHTKLSNIGTNTHAQIDTFITSYTPTTYFAGTMTVNSGTLISGTVTTLQTKDGTYVQVQEASGASPLTVTLDFTGLTTLDNLIFYGRYDGGSGHQVYVEMYNYITLSWDVLVILAHSNTDLWYANAIVCAQCVSGGAASIRFRHIQTGNTSHNLYLDYLAVRRGGSGGGGVTEHGALTGLTDDDHTQYLKADGTRALTADWDAGSFEIRAQTLESDVATGTAPLTIASTTVNTNLNADLLDGLHDTGYTKTTAGQTINVATAAELTAALAGLAAAPSLLGNVIIQLAAGTYASAVNIPNLVGNGFSLTLSGSKTTDLSTAATGGTAGTSQIQSTVVKTNAGWTVNAYRGKWLKFTSGTLNGQIRTIDQNTSDTIMLTGMYFSAAPANGDTFEIYSNSTVITGNIESINNTCVLYLTNINYNHFKIISTLYARMTECYQYVDVDYSKNKIQGSNIDFYKCYFQHLGVNAHIWNFGSVIIFQQCYAYGNSDGLTYHTNTQAGGHTVICLGTVINGFSIGMRMAIGGSGNVQWGDNIGIEATGYLLTENHFKNCITGLTAIFGGLINAPHALNGNNGTETNTTHKSPAGATDPKWIS